MRLSFRHGQGWRYGWYFLESVLIFDWETTILFDVWDLDTQLTSPTVLVSAPTIDIFRCDLARSRMTLNNCIETWLCKYACIRFVQPHYVDARKPAVIYGRELRDPVSDRIARRIWNTWFARQTFNSGYHAGCRDEPFDTLLGRCKLASHWNLTTPSHLKIDNTISYSRVVS